MCSSLISALLIAMSSLKLQEVEDFLKFKIWSSLLVPCILNGDSKFWPCFFLSSLVPAEVEILPYILSEDHYCYGEWSSRATPWFHKVLLLTGTLFQATTGNNLHNHNTPANHWLTIFYLNRWVIHLRSSTWRFLSWDNLWSQELYWLIQTSYESATVTI